MITPPLTRDEQGIYKKIKRVFADIAEERGVPVELIGANDIVLDNFSHHKEIISTDGERYFDIAWAVFAGKAGTLRLGVFEKPFRDQVKQLWLQMSGLTLSILLVAIGGSLFFIRRVTRPLASLAAAAETLLFEAAALDFEAAREPTLRMEIHSILASALSRRGDPDGAALHGQSLDVH